MSSRFHSLLLVEEKLLVAEHFMRRLSRNRGHVFGFELNGFLSAARSVTFRKRCQTTWLRGLAVERKCARIRLRGFSSTRSRRDPGSRIDGPAQITLVR
jgi:hypothetical protein